MRNTASARILAACSSSVETVGVDAGPRADARPTAPDAAPLDAGAPLNAPAARDVVGPNPWPMFNYYTPRTYACGVAFETAPACQE